MKQIPTAVGTAVAGTGITPIVSIFLPAASWLNSKNLLVRAFYQLTFPAGPPVPGYAIGEAWTTPQSGGTAYPTPPAFVATTGVFTTQIQRNFIRLDPQIMSLDLGDCMQFNFANFYDGITHVQGTLALVPPYDFSVPIQIDVTANLPGTFPGATLQALWAEAFLEQATNLGKLP